MATRKVYARIAWLMLIVGCAAQTLIAAPTAKKHHSDAKKSSTSTKRVQLEKKFESLLTNATLEGLWQMTGEGGLKSKQPLTPPKPERYTIISATKIGENDWLIQARVEIADDKDITIPVPVRVFWAGDTPVITLDEISLPMLGTYSARVMMHSQFYSGIWWSYAKNYGGTMAGRIIKEAPNGSASDQNHK